MLASQLYSLHVSEEQHVVFELSSKIINFIVTESEADSEPDSLIILSEEEMVLLDLVTAGWPQYRPPYLLSLHASAITCLSLHSEVPEDLLTELELLATSDKTENKFSARCWPVQGGECEGERASGDKPSLVITGQYNLITAV